MKKKFLSLSIFGLMAVILVISGCGSNKQATTKDREIVTKSQVKSFQSQKTQKKLDIFIPLQEQYKTSKHYTALDTLRKSQNQKPACYNCHSATYRFAPQNAKPDPYTLKNSITCYVCHELTIDEYKLRQDPLDTCVGCHTAGTITVGQAAHHAQKEMFMGYGAIDVPQMPDDKFQKGLTCIECHMPNKSHSFEGITPKESIKENKESVCVLCHTDVTEQQFSDYVDKIQNEIGNSLKAAKKDQEAVQKALDDAKTKGKDISVPLNSFNVAITDISIIDSDKSLGVHNYKYSKEILKVAQQKLNEAKANIK